MKAFIAVKLLILLMCCCSPETGSAQSDLLFSGTVSGLPDSNSVRLHFLMKNTDQVFTVNPGSYFNPLKRDGDFSFWVPFEWRDNERSVSLLHGDRIIWTDSLWPFTKLNNEISVEGIQLKVSRCVVRTISEGTCCSLFSKQMEHHFLGSGYDEQDLRHRGGVDHVLRDLIIPCNVPMRY